MKIKVCNSQKLAELKAFDLISAINKAGECIIGRSPDSGLVLDSPDVSRHHGKFFTTNGNYYFCDLGSRNGSMFNDELVEPHQEYLLKAGDTIHIGDFVLKIEQEEELPETVFKVIDPWLFKTTKPIEVREVSQAEEMALSSAAIGRTLEGIIPKSEEMLLPPAEINEVRAEVSTFVQPSETVNQVLEEVSELEKMIPPTETVNEPVAEEVFPLEEIVQPSETVNQVLEEVSELEEMIPPTETVNEPVAEEVFPLEEIVQPPEVVNEVVQEMQPTEEMIQPPEAISQDFSTIKPPELLIQKNIVVIAHDTKTPELVEFVAEHQELFSQCPIISWSSLSETINHQTGITLSQEIPSGTSGGYQTIASLVNSGEILAVIFLRDFMQPQLGQANEEALLRLCNINQVLLATNLATAKAIANYILSFSSSKSTIIS